jgi:cell division protein FtsI (penicillin-binding protein 3)
LKELKKDILWRVYLIYGLMLVFGLLIIGKVIKIQFMEGDEWQAKAKEETVKAFDVEAVRGTIYAENGLVLATSVPVFEVRMDVANRNVKDDDFYDKVDSLAFCLADLFGDKSINEYKNGLVNARKNGDGYYLLKRKVEYDQLKELREFPILRRGKYRGGLIIEKRDKRERPYRLLARRTIGFSVGDNYKVGLEGAYDNELKGVSGKILKQRTNNGMWMPITDESLVEPEDGKDIITTININLQDVAEDALMRQLERHGADHGCAVLMEVETGYIKAIANLKLDTNSGKYTEAYNYAVGGRTEPGSTFKLISMMAAIDDGKIDIYDTIPTFNGYYRYYDRDMEDAHGGYGNVTVKRAFEISSNVALSKLIYDHYSGKDSAFVNKLKKIGIDKLLGLEIAGEKAPMVKDPSDRRNWYGTTLPWMTIGYEVELTPLQLLSVYNAVANNGKMVKPQFVKEIRHQNKVVKFNEPVVLNESICKPETIKKLREMLEGVVQDGTARNVRNSVYKIAGKTGTAQVLTKQGYSKSKYKASFAGYFPADNPKYSCIVTINNPTKGYYYGSSVAAPVFKEIADKVYATRLDIHTKEDSLKTVFKPVMAKSGNQSDYKNIYKELGFETKTSNPSAEWVFVNGDTSSIQLKTKKVKYGYVPNVKGMGARDAVYLLEKLGLSVVIRGKGNVKRQSIQPGNELKKGKTIILELST